MADQAAARGRRVALATRPPVAAIAIASPFQKLPFRPVTSRPDGRGPAAGPRASMRRNERPSTRRLRETRLVTLETETHTAAGYCRGFEPVPRSRLRCRRRHARKTMAVCRHAAEWAPGMTRNAAALHGATVPPSARSLAAGKALPGAIERRIAARYAPSAALPAVSVHPA